VFTRIWLVVCVCCLIFACRSPKKEKADVTQQEPSKIKLIIKNSKLAAEIADTDEERMQGLMYRSMLAPDQGMLFVFEQEGIYPFYMKDTKIPLSIAFINHNGIIIDIQQMTPFDEQTEHYPDKPFLFALETNQGWFFERGIKIGDTVFGLPKTKF
jgi:hypothetical protein